MTNTISIAGTTLELVERGRGQPLVFLHAGEGLAPERPWLELLSRRYRVIAPSHPGYGESPLIDGGARSTISPSNLVWRRLFWLAPASAAGSRRRCWCAQPRGSRASSSSIRS